MLLVNVNFEFVFLFFAVFNVIRKTLDCESYGRLDTVEFFKRILSPTFYHDKPIVHFVSITKRWVCWLIAVDRHIRVVRLPIEYV